VRRAESTPIPSARAGRLSPAQEAELKDKLTLGRFLMDRQDYPAAIAEFRAALAIDSSNREAQAAMQQAREVSRKLDSSPPP
jgi:Tfp pilus assembly protein PilF